MRAAFLSFALLVAAATATATAPVALVLEGEVGNDPWVALRFNVTADNDLNVLGVLRAHLDGQERYGGATFLIQDGGSPKWQHASVTGAENWWIDMDSAHVATPLGRVDIGGDAENDLTRAYSFGGGAPSIKAKHSITFLAIADAPRAKYWANVTWTKGVISYDVASGSGFVRQADEMHVLAHAGSHSWLGPQASAGLRMHERFHTEHDFFGWFLPRNNHTSLYSSWSCTRDNVPCPGPGEGWPSGGGSIGLIPLASKGHTVWDLRIDANAEILPSVVIGAVEFPTDDYLADP